MSKYRIHDDIATALTGYEVPDQLGFGMVPGPIMYSAEYMDGVWSDGLLEANKPLLMQPSAKVLHYGQEIFEGMKAYRIHSDRATLFRPERNWSRFNQSALRMAMPEIPEELFMEGVYLVTAYSENVIPRISGKSLYLRPFMFASETNLGVSGANQFTYMVVSSPSEAMHPGTMKVLIEREYSRAALGGTGGAKTGGNYASSFASRQHAQSMGFDQSLWLDPRNQKNIEELSVMNFFAVINGELHTPRLTGSLLDGVTRDSILSLAEYMGIVIHQRAINIDELIAQIKSQECDEIFCCGTGAIISPISTLGEYDGTCYELIKPDGDLSLKLRDSLLGIQESRLTDGFGWLHNIPEQFYPK